MPFAIWKNPASGFFSELESRAIFLPGLPNDRLSWGNTCVRVRTFTARQLFRSRCKGCVRKRRKPGTRGGSLQLLKETQNRTDSH